MIIINACIYNSTELGTVETEKLNSDLKLLSIEQFTNVFTVPNFLAELDANRDKEIVLFSNFPHKKSYLEHTVSQSLLDNYEKNAPTWNVAPYKVSAGLISQICKARKFKAIHFITGAPIEYVSDSLILSLTGNYPTTIKRKHDWTVEGANFDVMRRLYMLQRIKEAVAENS